MSLLRFTRRHVLHTAAAAALLPLQFLLPAAAHAQAAAGFPAEVRLDWGYYSPHTLLIKDKGWLEAAFKDTGTQIKWVQSRGSNNSLEFLKVGATDFAGSAGLSAFIARANGVPLKVIYNASWGASQELQVLADSPLHSVKALKGKRIAVTKGTAPYFTLLQALADNGLKVSDIRVVHLQHPEGFAALQQKQVDAWIGIDPHTSIAQAAGARTIYHNLERRQPSVFSTTEKYLAQYPQVVERVLQVWASTQEWVKSHPDEFKALVAQQTQTGPQVTQLILARRLYNDPAPGPAVTQALRELIPLVQEEGILQRNVDVEGTLAGLQAPEPARKVLAAAPRP
ncbi:MAG: aliphatic sulfonate ABC transporter substrate-binding protein [Comamonadaceae bacterium]|nr:MAG: aliphatic sulfonate ABC transporter substrate-binding protein [Comamonadaceae bacterium]